MLKPPLPAKHEKSAASSYPVQPGVRDLGEVMMLIVESHIVRNRVQGAVVRIGLLPLQ